MTHVVLELSVGMELPKLVVIPTAVQLFRFSAVTWNAHKVHYDRDFAQAEGHPDVLVQAHLHGAFLTQMVMRWIAPERGRLLSIDWKNRARAVPGDTLTCKGVIEGIDVGSEGRLVRLALSETNQRSEICVTGSAVVTLPGAFDPHFVPTRGR